MHTKKILTNLIIFLGIPTMITIAMYLINFKLFSNRSFSPTEPLFIEGILFLLLGALLFLGRGGINLWTAKAAILAAATKAISKKDTIGPNEIMKKDRWKAEGFPRLALILIISGALMLIAYFLTLK